MHPLAKVALGAAFTAFTNEALVKPQKVAKLAHAYSRRVHKPMLSFVPPPGATIKSLLASPPTIGDLNLHPAGRQPPGAGRVSFGSPYQVRVPPRTFACVFSCDTLEHLDRPDLALLEWHRIADRVFIVAPPWWTPDAWLNKWYIDPALKKAWPIWAAQNRIIWLPAPMRGAYDAGTCQTPPQRRVPTTAPKTEPKAATEVPATVPGRPGPVSNASPPPAAPSLPENLPMTMEAPAVESTAPSEVQSPGPDLPYLPLVEEGSPSFTSVSSMMIVSGSDFESD